MMKHKYINIQNNARPSEETKHKHKAVMLAMSDMSQMISAKQTTTHLWPSNQIDSSWRSAKHANKPTKTSKTHLKGGYRKKFLFFHKSR